MSQQSKGNMTVSSQTATLGQETESIAIITGIPLAEKQHRNVFHIFKILLVFKHLKIVINDCFAYPCLMKKDSYC